jgi:diphthamide synthase (EF-2-diphthine--ammonia ligase)
MKALLAWSSGKDSAWSLHVLRRQGDVEVVGLLTTVNEAFGRVAMHAVRRELLEAQARAAGVPLFVVPIPYPCPNPVYEAAMAAALAHAREAGIEAVAFGDLFLEDVRRYREERMAGAGRVVRRPLVRSRAARGAAAGGRPLWGARGIPHVRFRRPDVRPAGAGAARRGRPP